MVEFWILKWQPISKSGMLLGGADASICLQLWLWRKKVNNGVISSEDAECLKKI